jgi:glutathione-regulated potassium-efflux system ancillary protein KefC/glutathione-regulated potassium-efflux system protein KefB
MISLAQVAILLTAAVVAVSLFRLSKMSSILGFLAAGLIIGPWGLRLITDVSSILNASEFGVVLLLFVIGLELQPTRLWVMRRTVFGLGSLQVLCCGAVLGAAAWWWGLPLMAACVVGFGLSLSSTPLVLQVLAERNQLKTQYGRAAFSILLFQDLAVLPMLAVLPLLSPLQSAHTGSPWFALVKLIAVIAIVTVGGRLVLRPALRVVARIRVTEVFTAAALLVVIATALLVNEVGLSMALGAFLAGVVLADSEFRHELEADIEPFKGLLLGLFFIAVGMTANVGLIIAQPLKVIAGTALFMALKILVVALVGRATGRAKLAAWRMGFTLPAGGEFAFVLFALAARQRILDAGTADLLVLIVTLSMMTAPLVLTLHDRVRKALVDAGPQAPFDNIDERDNRVIIAGFGRVGQIVSRVLRARRIKFTALDSNQTHVDFVRRFGNRIYYGDASRLDLLRAAGAESADLFVLAIDDTDASLRTAEIVRTYFPGLKVLARARNRQHAFALMDQKVDYIVRETYGSSLELAEQALIGLGDTPAVARAAVRKFRQHDERTLSEQYSIKEDEAKLISAARESAQQLEKLFESDVAKSEQG